MMKEDYMTELLQYPFDIKLLTRKKQFIKNELLAKGRHLEKRVAVLGGSTTHDIVEMIELFLLDNGIRPIFYESEYNKFWEDAMFGNPALDNFRPDVVFIHTTARNIQSWPEIDMAQKAVENVFDQTAGRFEAMWASLAEKFKCPIVQNNFEYLPYRLLGNLDGTVRQGRTNFIRRLNSAFAEYALLHDGFFINDICWQSSDLGLSRWHDEAYWCLYKYAMSKDAVPIVAFNVANILKSLFGKNKKALALDLDNTLWGGIVGDDGAENLELGTETALGQAYVEFQQYLKTLRKQGVLLNVISKNEEAAASSGMAHPQMVLKKSDFISIKANWEPKSENLIKMAKELSLLPESFVFVDDNPAEREIVRQQVPGCAVPDIGSVERYLVVLDHGGYFEATKISKDDLKRNEMYRENIARTQLQASFADYGEYLKSLDMHAQIRPFEAVYMGRIAQLTNKSNQFNLTTRRYSQEEIEQVASDARFIARYGQLSDKFGDNGVVAISIGELKEDVLELVLWLMSCRVLKRDMEFAMMDEMVAAALPLGIKTIRGFYYPTAKNAMVKNFFATQGFSKVAEDDEGNTTWELDISVGYTKKNKYIGVNR